MRISKKVKIFLQGFLLVHLLWYIIALAVNIKVLPSPMYVYLHLDKLNGLMIGSHVVASLFRVVSGILISLFIGVPIGLLMGYSKSWNKILNPLVYFTYPVPKTALLPIIMILFGLGDTSKITMIVLIVVFVVIVTVRDAVLNIDPQVYQSIKSLGSSKWQTFQWVTLPATLPELLTNLRVAVGTSLSILFFTEGYGTHYGIGYFILDAWTRIDYIDMYAGIIVLSLLGFLLFVLVDLLEEKVCKWKSV